ncbi:MAG: class I mannose-6-phosphate isomerase [Actinomycetota bacterium]|nr:class I mannose-6-phosphate isomerase [Actinomycetota bacterium]
MTVGEAETPVYDPNPLHDVIGGEVVPGWDGSLASLETSCVLAIDGVGAVDWDAVVDAVTAALRRREIDVVRVDVSECRRPGAEVVAATTSAGLADDPHFERLADLLDVPSAHRAGPHEVVVLAGPGAALLEHDVLRYLDLPKRFAEADVTAGRARNLGQRDGDGRATTKRLFYVDWPMLDRHRDNILGEVDRWFDVQDADRPTSVDGTTLRRVLANLARRPVRTRPTFNTTPWGGQWARRELGMEWGAANTALGYELIAPESGILIGDRQCQVELPFQLLVSAHPTEVLSGRVHDVFGTSFPIRFDYLDTVEGGNLSVHCHPRSTYMREVFGWPYTQHETYYVVVGGPNRRVFLGLHDGVDVEEFRRDATRSRDVGDEMDIERWVQTFPAQEHQLFCIPAGTPHGSGEGTVVLEVSATPYLYSLRFYDWLRRDAGDRRRPVHIDHAFANLDRDRTGETVAEELVPEPKVLRQGPGWREEVLGALPEMFYEVRRLVFDDDESVPEDATDGFHVLNVVDGVGVEVTWDGGRQVLARAETIVIPAAVGDYRLRRVGAGRVRVVKALVR